MANNVDPDHTVLFPMSDLGLHYLLRPVCNSIEFRVYNTVCLKRALLCSKGNLERLLFLNWRSYQNMNLFSLS